MTLLVDRRRLRSAGPISSGTFVSAIVIDTVLGDPEWLPHPVRLIGWAANRLESLLRRRRFTPGSEFALGALMTSIIVAGAVLVTRVAIGQSWRRDLKRMSRAEVYLAASCIALRSLLVEARKTIRLLDSGEITSARRQLARIVGRDTHELSPSEVSRAVIETLAESLCDGVVAPIFFLALGGVPCAMGYKAINTLDSMIGHRNRKYLYFGRAAARLDDLANLLPSRLAAASLAAAAFVVPNARPSHAWNTWLEDGSRHASPNAGQTEAAMAGALQVRLGGANTYAGERMESPVLGSIYRPPGVDDAKRALTLTAVAGCIAAVAVWTWLCWRERR
ncbi:MAG TPA: adenosylcobinamide-phosphate synthase CbiB [Acidobacteriaceae bacterium]